MHSALNNPPLRRFLLLFAALFLTSVAAEAQGLGVSAGGPREYEVLSVSVEGTEDEPIRQFVTQTANIQPGQRLTIPGDEVLADAIRQLFTLGSFHNVEIIADGFEGDGVHLIIRITEAPRIGDVVFDGIRTSWADEIRLTMPLLRGRPLRTNELQRSEQIIEEYLAEKGFRLARVEVEQTAATDNRVNVLFRVTRGPRVAVGSVDFEGNEAFSDNTLRRRLSNTKAKRWWRFWSRHSFDDAEFQEDLESLILYYNDRGYYAARVVDHSISMEHEEGSPELAIDILVDEGPQYFVRNIVFDGNTEYTDEQLALSLGIEPGEPYNRTRIERNVYYNRNHTDIYSLYQDRGYLRFHADLRVIETAPDSLDLVFEIQEGDIYQFGRVEIRGNTRTKDHVIRRSLRTVPGATYSRQSVERSVRELMQLGYFDPESLSEGPAVSINESTKTVDLVYRLIEAGGDQLELSGGWGGSGYGVIIQARVTFNNFSIQNLFNKEAWRPIPSGDGQQLSLGIQASGLHYQNYSISFTEPYFRGRNTPVGFSVSYSRRDLSRARHLWGNTLPDEEDANMFRTFSSRIFYRQQLAWPDDFFQIGTDLNYRLYDVAGSAYADAYRLPLGISQELTLRQTLSRNSFDHPIFPSSGSSFTLSAEVAVPISSFNQFHKEQFSTSWVTPLFGRLSLQFSGDFGYIGSLTGDEVQFQRFMVGGSPLEVQGSYLGYGKDLIFMRGYPLGAISPRQDGQIVGGRILNKYALELRLFAHQSAQFSFAPYLFADAGNAWDGFADYNPSNLYRSAGFGAKIFLPILGVVDLNYGYAVDRFADPRDGSWQEPSWRFQFSLGQ